VIAGSGGGGTSSSFGSSFPATGTAIGGQYLTSPPTLTTGQMNGLLLSSVGRLVVDGSGVTQPVSGTITANQGGAPWTMKPDGTAWALTGTSANVNLTNASVAVTGTFWQTTQPVSAASLPLPTGAATSANQPTAAAVGSTSSGQIGNVAMGFTTTGAPTYTTAQTNPLSLTTAGGLRVDGSATTQPVSGSVSITGTATVTGTVTANQGGAPWSMKPDGTTWAMTSTSANVNLTNASVAVTGTFWQATQPVSAASLPLPTGAATSANQPTNAAAASTTSGQTGGLALGAVTTAAPSYTTATSNYLSLTTAGALRVDGSAVTQPVSGTFWQATQPVSGTVTANQGGTWNVTNISGTISLPTGASTSANQPSNAGQGSTTSGQTGTLGMGAVTTGSPSYTTAQTSPFSLTTAGALRVDGSAVTQPVSGTVAVTQSGTWTVQPGNTANTTAWLVTGTGGVFPASQSGTWNITNVSGTVSLPTGASTSANQPSNATQGSTTSGQTGNLGMGAVTTSAPSYTTAQTSPLSLTTTGGLRVDLTGTGANTTALKVDGSAVTQPVSVAAAVTVQQATAANLKGQVDPLTAANWGIGSSTQNSASVANGVMALAQFNTSPTAITSGNMSPLQMDGSGNLLVNIKAGAGSGGTAAQDAAAFTAGTTNYTPAGGFFQTTATNNALTNGQGGAWQMTANRAGFVNLRTATGIELGSNASPLWVYTPSPTQGTGSWTSVTTLNSVISMLATTFVTYNTIVGQLTQGTTLTGGAVTFEESYDGGTNYKTIPVSRLIDPVTGSQLTNPYTFVASTNQAFQIIATGATNVRARLSTVIAGTGTVAVQSDLTTAAHETLAFQNNAANFLCTASQGGTWTSRCVGNGGGVFDFASTQNIATPGQAILIGGEFNTTPTTITSGNSSPLQLDSAGNVLVNIKSTVNQQCVGEIASGTTDSGNPQKIGGLAKTANPTAVSDGQRVTAIFDKLGKQVVVGALRDLKKLQTTTITTTTETTIVTAGSSGVFNDIYGLTISNTSGTAVNVAIKDSTAGTTRMTVMVPAGDMRGFTVPVDSAMVQATAANNWTATVSAAASSIFITALYVQCT